MKINDNGIIRDMTPEEIREMQEAMEHMPPPPPDPLEGVNQKLDSIMDMLRKMMGGPSNG